jgi:hypothetical protein
MWPTGLPLKWEHMACSLQKFGNEVYIGDRSGLGFSKKLHV